MNIVSLEFVGLCLTHSESGLPVNMIQLKDT